MKNVLRLIIGALFLALLVLFLLPFAARIVCAGNCAGVLISAAGLAVCMFWNGFTSLISRLWERLPGRIAVTAFGVVTGVCVIGALVISILMLCSMNDKPKGDTTLVVLGCQVRGTHPSLMLGRRLDTACDYMTAHPEVNAVLSGGKGDDEEISEAQCMYDYLTGRGIAPDRLYMEDKSTTTQENIRFSKELISGEGLCPDITIVTDGFHQLRADRFARKEGLNANNLSAHTPYWLLPTYWVREWFGIVYYTFFS